MLMPGHRRGTKTRRAELRRRLRSALVLLLLVKPLLAGGDLDAWLNIQVKSDETVLQIRVQTRVQVGLALASALLSQKLKGD
jgi:hypothetical protein